MQKANKKRLYVGNGRYQFKPWLSLHSYKFFKFPYYKLKHVFWTIACNFLLVLRERIANGEEKKTLFEFHLLHNSVHQKKTRNRYIEKKSMHCKLPQYVWYGDGEYLKWVTFQVGGRLMQIFHRLSCKKLCFTIALYQTEAKTTGLASMNISV